MKGVFKMKRFIIVAAILIGMFFASNVMAASSMVAKSYGQPGKNMLVIAIVCTAHTDGTFTSEEITSAEVGQEYWKGGFYLAHAWAVNSATDDHTNAAVVTVTDSTGQQVVGATVGDTLTLSQTASATAYLSASRSAAQRPVVAPLTVAIADTGSTATVQTIYLLLVR